MADRTEDGADRGERNSLALDALAVSDRFRLFNFTRRDDHVAYLWVLRALDRLRAVHEIQAHTDDVAGALAELAAVYDEAPRLDGGLREKLDALADDGMVHRLEDASRAGSLARYRNRQSVYQFSELGYRAFTAVEDVLSARIRDANLSRLVFSDILNDLKALAQATRDQDKDQVYRRLSRLDTVLDDMSRRAAQFHLTLGEIMRSTDTSPDTFLRYKWRARRRRADLQPGDLVGCARRGDLGDPVPAGKGADPGRPSAGQVESRGQSRTPPPPGGGAASRTGSRPALAERRRAWQDPRRCGDESAAQAAHSRHRGADRRGWPPHIRLRRQ